jgi:hypothetical protein
MRIIPEVDKIYHFLLYASLFTLLAAVAVAPERFDLDIGSGIQNRARPSKSKRYFFADLKHKIAEVHADADFHLMSTIMPMPIFA